MKYINYKKYGKCAKLSKGGKTMLVTVDIGPRIIFYGEDGGENIFYEDIDDLINKDDGYLQKNLAGKGIWHIYGGHRLWKSPEYMDTYYPDNEPVAVEETDDGVTFVSPVEITTGLKKSIKIKMSDDGNAIIEHGFTNCGENVTPPIALWTLSVMEKGAIAKIPLSTEDKGLLPNRNLVLWSYTDIKDERLQIDNDCVTLSQKNISRPIKLGMYVDQPIEVKVKGMTLRIEYPAPRGEYADFCCNVETYTNDIMLEIETLSSLKELKKGESAVHTVKWSLTK